MAQSYSATQRDILDAVVYRLHERVPEFTEITCFLSDQVTPVLWPAGPLCCTVTVLRGVYPDPFTTGGGHATICKDMTLGVTPWVRCSADSQPSQEVALHDRSLGLWSRWEPDILRALLCDWDGQGNPQGWMPLASDGTGMLRNYPSPRDTSPARPDSTTEWLGMTVSFDFTFDWLL